jgi:hypothetical protein
MGVNFCTPSGPKGQQVIFDVNTLSWKGDQSKVLSFKV